MQRLQNKSILITGGGSGIGLAATRALLHEGARVAITGRDEAKLQRAAESLENADRLIYRRATGHRRPGRARDGMGWVTR